MNTPAAHQHLRRLEESLHTIDVRSNPAELENLLHEDFVEFGRSGTIYRRREVLDEFKDETGTLDVSSSHFEFTTLSEEVVLITYRSSHVVAGTRDIRWSLRSSIWQRAGREWKLRFHQGTPME